MKHSIVIFSIPTSIGKLFFAKYLSFVLYDWLKWSKYMSNSYGFGEIRKTGCPDISPLTKDFAVSFVVIKDNET
jgi:hypothetical protein